MSRWTVTAVVAEAGLLGLLGALGFGVAGRSPGATSGLGAVLVLSLAVPSLYLLMWGRGRSSVEFMAALAGVILGKMMVVGAALAVVVLRTGLPAMAFVWGLMGGWVLSFTLQALVLKRTLGRSARETVR